ncbi:MAG: winged helix-turn-helix transcriptional regulator [Thermoleophilaceae bacterium]
MLGREYDTQNCSIARALELVGERWTLLILRNVFFGLRRFDDLQRQLGIARNVLAARLDRLVDGELLERRPYGDSGVRHEYRLTDKGRALWPTLVELMHWGDRYAAPAGGPPTVVRHQGCGGEIGPHQMCRRCGALLELQDIHTEVGPGATAEHPLLTRAA